MGKKKRQIGKGKKITIYGEDTPTPMLVSKKIYLNVRDKACLVSTRDNYWFDSKEAYLYNSVAKRNANTPGNKAINKAKMI